MEPFHACSNRPKQSSLILAIVTPVIVIGFLALVAVTAGAFHDPAILIAIGGFAVVALILVIPTCLQLVSVEEIYIDHQALLIRRTLGKRVKERSVRIAQNARAHTGIDRRWHLGSGAYEAINIELVDGKTFYFGDGLNRSQQGQLAEQINDYLSAAAATNHDL